MLKSFVGIATRHGLEVFLPEHEHVVRFLTRRVRREALRRAVCYWAVLPDEAAWEVRRQMDLGEAYIALLLLDHAATELGPILPADTSDHEEARLARFCFGRP
jgi:hypothetical protein